MTHSTIVADIMVCVDCLAIVANGELGQGDETADAAHAARMADQWPTAEGYTLALNTQEGDEGSFSWSWCGGCGSTLGGDRHPVVVFQAVAS